MLGTDTAKDRIFARMKIPLPGPGYMHLPHFVDDEYLEQLTSEKRIRRVKKGGQFVREYIKTRARNEALDLEVYNLAALYTIGNWKLNELGETAEELTTPQDAGKTEAIAQVDTTARQALRPQTRGTGGSGWVKNW